MTKRIASLGEAVAGERLQLPSEATRIDNALSWELPSRTKSRDQRIMRLGPHTVVQVDGSGTIRAPKSTRTLTPREVARLQTLPGPVQVAP
jgi:site-specific DNA-cytosine methylase